MFVFCSAFCPTVVSKLSPLSNSQYMTQMAITHICVKITENKSLPNKHLIRGVSGRAPKLPGPEYRISEFFVGAGPGAGSQYQPSNTGFRHWVKLKVESKTWEIQIYKKRQNRSPGSPRLENLPFSFRNRSSLSTHFVK